MAREQKKSRRIVEAIFFTDFAILLIEKMLGGAIIALRVGNSLKNTFASDYKTKKAVENEFEGDLEAQMTNSKI